VTTTFRELAELRGRKVAMTIDLVLPDRTLYLSDMAVKITNDYEPVVTSWGDSRVSADCDAGITKTSDFEFTVANKKLEFQPHGKRFGDLFSEYLFFNAVAIVKLNLFQPTTETWVSTQIRRGVVDQIKIAPGSFRFMIIADQSYNRPFPPSTFRREDTGMSRLPDSVVGTPIPVIYGDWWNTPRNTVDPKTIEAVGIVRNTVPAILYDSLHPETGLHLYRICSHYLKSEIVEDTANQAFLYDSNSQTLASLRSCLNAWDVHTAYSDVKFIGIVTAEIPIKPLKDSGSSAIFPTLSFDRDETSYARVYYNQPLWVEMEPITDLGDIVDAYIEVMLRRMLSSNVSLQIGLTTSDGGSESYGTIGMTPDANPVLHTVDLNPAMVNWKCTHPGGSNTIRLFVRLEPGATSGLIYVYETCLKYKFRPSGMKGTATAVERTLKVNRLHRHWRS
jgi:hypothetical protein